SGGFLYIALKPASLFLEPTMGAMPPPLPPEDPGEEILQPEIISEAPVHVPRFEAEAYRAAGTLTALGIFLTPLLGIAAAVFMGWLASFIGQWFYLILLFPIGITFGVVIGCAGGITWGKVSSPAFAFTAGGLCGLVAMVSMHYFDYLHTGA